MTEDKVAIIVVNWNLQYETARCLQSLARLEQPHRIVLVDNGSTDGSVEYLRSHFPYVSLLSLPENLGFGAGCNRAVQTLLPDPDWEYVLLINNDAVIHPEAVTHLLEEARLHPEAGIFGPKIYVENPPEQLWYAGARRRRGVLAAAGTGRGQVDHGQFDLRQEVDFVFGAGMLIRREVIQDIGLFDERYFIYLEDLDYCLRAQKAGYSLRFVPQARLWHRVSASTEHLQNWRKYHQARSTILFLKKHTTPALVIPVLGFWLLVFLRSILHETMQGNVTSLGVYLSGLVNGMIHASRQPNQLPDAY